MQLTITQLQAVLDTYDDGVLMAGAHTQGEGKLCALECVALARQLPLTDNPITVHMPDLRPLNDAHWSSPEKRTQALLPLLAALSSWSTWTPARRAQWVARVIIQTVNLLIARLPHLPEAMAKNCKEARTLEAAAAAVGVALETSKAEGADFTEGAIRAAATATQTTTDQTAEWSAQALAAAAAWTAAALEEVEHLAAERAGALEAATRALQAAIAVGAGGAAQVVRTAQAARMTADEVLQLATTIWLQAVQETEGL